MVRAVDCGAPSRSWLPQRRARLDVSQVRVIFAHPSRIQRSGSIAHPKRLFDCVKSIKNATSIRNQTTMTNENQIEAKDFMVEAPSARSTAEQSNETFAQMKQELLRIRQNLLGIEQSLQRNEKNLAGVRDDVNSRRLRQMSVLRQDHPALRKVRDTADQKFRDVRNTVAYDAHLMNDSIAVTAAGGEIAAGDEAVFRALYCLNPNKIKQ